MQLMATDAAPPPVSDEIIPPADPVWIRRGTAPYRNAGVALFLAGFASFSLIYCVQPLLPSFAQSFKVNPAEASLALSLTTGFLAFSIVMCGAFSQALGRKGLMFGSMALAAGLNICAALSPNWHGLLAARALEGLVLGGVPAVAMAYLAEEIEPKSLGRSMGLYVAGTAFGAMMGRVGMGVMTEFTSWRIALFFLGALGLASALGFLTLLPASRNFVAQRGAGLGYHLRTWRACLANPGLRRLYVTGFALTSVFVTLFNYATFRLAGEPYLLNPTRISLIFLVFGFGIVSSSTAGGLVDRFGRKTMLMAGFSAMLTGVLLTLSPALPVVILGVILVTTGFFIGHSVVSSSVGPLAGNAKGHAASLYLLFYYMGSSITGSVGGWFWQHGGWGAIVALTCAAGLIGLVLSATARKTA
jgi:YNFM family putative membrane transporter